MAQIIKKSFTESAEQNLFSGLLNILILVFAATILVACNKEDGDLNLQPEDLIEQDSILDKSAFIEQSKNREDPDYRYGPQFEDDGVDTNKKRYRKLVNKEESFNYSDINELKEANFKIDINPDMIKWYKTLGKRIDSLGLKRSSCGYVNC